MKIGSLARRLFAGAALSVAMGLSMPALAASHDAADAKQAPKHHKTEKHRAQSGKAVKTARQAKGTDAGASRHSVAHSRHHHKLPRESATVRSHAPLKHPVTREGGNSRLSLESRSALVMDAATGEVLFQKNATESVPIASITKLMTAMVVLDAHQDMSDTIRITEEDVDHLRNSSSRLRVGAMLPRSEMMLIALMASENRAAHSLARSYPGGVGAAIDAMNAKAVQLGMTSTRFYDPTGLNSGNKASLQDLAKLAKAASHYPDIHRYSTTANYTVELGGSRQQIHYINTNPLVNSKGWEIGVTKTGYIQESGRCLVMEAHIASRDAVIVLMNSWGKQSRIGDATRVRRWLESSSLASAQRF